MVWRFLDGYARTKMTQRPTFRFWHLTEKRRRMRRSLVHLLKRRRNRQQRKFRPMSSAGGWMIRISWADPKGQRSVFYSILIRKFDIHLFFKIWFDQNIHCTIILFLCKINIIFDSRLSNCLADKTSNSKWQFISSEMCADCRWIQEFVLW